MKKKETFTFEEGYARAVALVEAVERGEMPLNQTFEAYEQAAELLKTLEMMLNLGEKRIEMLMGGKTEDIAAEVENEDL